MADEQEKRGLLAQGGALLAGAYHKVMEGGEIQAAIRQGFKELGNAFGQFWPEQITVSEPGSMTNPLFSELAADQEHHAEAKREAWSSLPSPSEIAKSQPIRPPADRGQEQGREM